MERQDPEKALKNNSNNNTSALKSQCNNSIRNVPHVEGNFATLIYLKVHSTLGSKFYSCLEFVETNFPLGDKISNLKKFNSAEYHVSLSPTIYLKYHQINSFVTSLKMRLKSFKQRLKLILSDKLKCFSNEYNTTAFLSLEILKNNYFNKVYGAILDHIESYGLGDMTR